MNNPKALTVVQLTPPGRGAVATLRIEGAGAIEAVQTNFRARDGRSIAEHPADQLTVGRFDGDGGEDVVVRRCGDDTVELHCHGGWAAVARIEELLVAAGCQKFAWRDWAAARHADSVATVALAALADARTERTAAILLDQYYGAWDHAIAEIQKSIDDGDREAAQRQLETLLARAPLGTASRSAVARSLGRPCKRGQKQFDQRLGGVRTIDRSPRARHHTRHRHFGHGHRRLAG